MNLLQISASLLVGIIGSLLATFLFPALQNAVQSGIVRLFGWVPFRRKSSLTGPWRSEWHVESEKYPPIVVDESATVRQVGTRFYAKFRSKLLDCHLVGTIDSGRYVTGTWYDDLEGGYHGAFQFIVDPTSGKSLSGKWIGYSTTGRVKEGDWTWEQHEFPS